MADDPRKSAPLERYVTMMEALAAAPEGMTVRDLVTVLDLPKSTVIRLLAALEASGLTRAAPRKGAHILGGRLLRLLQADESWLEIGGRRILQALVRATGETCFVTRLGGGRIRYVLRETPSAGMVIHVSPGHALPAHATATGKLLTALQPPEMRSAILGPGPFSRASGPPITRAALEAELDLIARRGWSVEDGEHVAGLMTLAVPLRLPVPGPPIHALGLTGLSAPTRARAEAELLPQLQAAAAELAAAFGPYLSPEGLD